MQILARKTTLATALLLATTLASPARAQQPGDRFWIELEAYWASIDTKIEVASVPTGRLATRIDMESDLGLDDHEALPAALVGARLGRRWLINAEYYSLRRDTTKSLEREITFEDVTYPLSASVTSEFNTDIYRATIGYSFVQSGNLDIGAGIGVHATHVEVSLEGQGQAGGNTARFERRAEDFLFPMPTVGLFANYRATSDLTFNVRADYLALSVGDYRGRLINAQAAAVYRIFNHVGVGLAFRYVDYRVDAEKDRFTGRFDYDFWGPAVVLQAGF